MEHVEIILPIFILAFAFIIKLVVDRTIGVVDVLQALCEFPVDGIFMSLSITVAYTISKQENQIIGVISTLILIVIAPLVVFLRKRSLELLEKRNYLWTMLLCLNLFLSTTSIVYSVRSLL